MDKVTLEVLTELEKTSKNFWNVSVQTANFLSILIKSTNRKSVLEIGTSNGYSGIWLAKALKETGGKMTTLEFWDKRLSVAVDNFTKCGVNDIITPKLGSACDIIPTLCETFDFVFVDANKGEYIKYYDLFLPKLSSHAIIAADNVHSHREKVQPFIDKITANSDFQVQILDLPDGLLLAYKLT